ncbi:M28 family metallopeptidase [Marilutibacter chinensis]|uniref:M28 family peptidase n=1 Tax=Marilutibacter chinensis TaxID=2912247 RepID=A0ABS9HNG8_9GAMM|nr:M28 family peptidase [Lysobacter chinensis]MCF7220540.1 M28 family peptidase [Lysobacter chinensis]
MRRHHALAIIASLALALSACTSLPSPSSDRAATPLSPAASGWHGDVVAIVAGGDNAGRGEAIVRQLEALRIPWQAQPFEIDEQSGRNLLATVSGTADAPLLLLGAHYDKVDVGDGVTDNASGSAVVLALAQRFRERPLAHHRVAVAFWDLEERGLLGSRAYIEQDSEQPALYVNFDVFGWGDTLWMMSPDPASPMTDASRAAADAARLAFAPGEQYPPTDHRAFLKAGWPAVSYSMVGAEEIDGILAMYQGRKPKRTPKVMKVIHSDDDTLSALDAEAVARGVDVVEAALRRWDASKGVGAAAAGH